MNYHVSFIGTYSKWLGGGCDSTATHASDYFQINLQSGH